MSATPLRLSNCSARTQKGHIALEYMRTFAMVRAPLLGRKRQVGLAPCGYAAREAEDFFEAGALERRDRRLGAEPAGCADHHRAALELVEFDHALFELRHRDVVRVG